MPAVAVVGDLSTTTTLALTSAWPAGGRPGRSGNTPPHRRPVVVEADPSGGSLAAWLDTPVLPSLSTMVAAVHREAVDDPDAVGPVVESLIRTAPTGTRFVPCPFRTREARRTTTEAGRAVFGALARLPDAVVLFDCGRIGAAPPAASVHSDRLLVAHRQDDASPAAATVRLERLAEQCDDLRTTGRPITVAVVGDRPFPLSEIEAFLGPTVDVRELAHDPLAAATLAGRPGISERRLARLPLMRSAAKLTAELERHLCASAATPQPSRFA